ncbi:DUF6344 domain-containing protein [Streptomyces sp. NPDC019396]|uniref:DUF6344 domain-containing protein n=1 Tax=Streptomyces sp. NPDC019396 TaxID=3154687 RepID=UPI0034060B91
MAAVKVTSLWTALISLFAALFASLGLTGSASASRKRPALPVPLETEERVSPRRTRKTRRTRQERQTYEPQIPGAGRVPRQGAASQRAPRDRSLPPTIKQRIGAEAHGTSPSVRYLPEVPDGLALLQGPLPEPGATVATPAA